MSASTAASSFTRIVMSTGPCWPSGLAPLYTRVRDDGADLVIRPVAGLWQKSGSLFVCQRIGTHRIRGQVGSASLVVSFAFVLVHSLARLDKHRESRRTPIRPTVGPPTFQAHVI